ncbi:MAG: extracellular solute-binding protein [Nocardioidaceae bacterium]
MLHKAGVSGIPSTWAEFLDAAKALTSGDVKGMSLNAAQSEFYSAPWFMQNGVNYYDPEAEDTLVPHQAALEAMRFQHDLVYKHKVAPVPSQASDYTIPRKLFTAGRVGMIFTGPWDVAPIQEGNPDLRFHIGQALHHKKQGAPTAGSSMFVPKKAKHPDLAWDLIKRLTTLDVELQVTKESSQTMPRRSWAESEQVKNDPMLAPFGEGLKYASDYVADAARSGALLDLSDDFRRAWQQIMMQRAPVEDTLATFRRQAHGDLSRTQ